MVQREFEDAAPKEYRQELKEGHLNLKGHQRPDFGGAQGPNKRQFRAPRVTDRDGKWCRNWAARGTCTFASACKWAETHVAENMPDGGQGQGIPRPPPRG